VELEVDLFLGKQEPLKCFHCGDSVGRLDEWSFGENECAAGKGLDGEQVFSFVLGRLDLDKVTIIVIGTFEPL
jgi:hypothetical protein